MDPVICLPAKIRGTQAAARDASIQTPLTTESVPTRAMRLLHCVRTASCRFRRRSASDRTARPQFQRLAKRCPAGKPKVSTSERQ